MTEKMCAQGHVVDDSRETCSRCNGPAVSFVDGTPLKPEVDQAAEASAETADASSEEEAKTEESTEESAETSSEGDQSSEASAENQSAE